MEKLDGKLLSSKIKDEIKSVCNSYHQTPILAVISIGNNPASEIYVKKDDVISQGLVIGKSGENKLDKDLGNHLHFEIYANGQRVNPLILVCIVRVAKLNCPCMINNNIFYKASINSNTCRQYNICSICRRTIFN